MTTRPATVRARSPLPRLSPLVLAIVAAFPALAATPVVRPPTPAPNTVPVPAPVGWVVSTSTPGLSTPVPAPVANSAGGKSLTINQASTSAVYNWASFDIGSSSSVTFNYPSAIGSSLNRVTGSTAPSAIFGALKSQYTDANGVAQVGGSIYLINANGILFGQGAQVNTGALIASTLDLQNADFYTGMSQSIAQQAYTFGAFNASGITAASLLPGANNFVLVDSGATIPTASGGRVFLFANNTVQNAGTINTPNGQTVLAAGDQVYLNLPTNEPMYASEVNAAIPAVNGLLVEVGTGNGNVANLQGGVINTPTGNTTLVGMAVNQSGRISATTSVSQDGSVFLLARGGATAKQGANLGVILKEATAGGTLTLGSGSSIVIAPDTSVDANGNQATSNATASFTPSVVQLSGKTIELQSGSSIVAHGGVVDARAESVPYYEVNGVPPQVYDYAAMTGDGARLAVDANATIDVSGTTDATVSAARNFVTTALLGANDLADAPLQRTGPIYRSELTFDVRSPVPILGNTSAYVNAIEKTATEQLAAGGTVKLESTGAVVTNAASTLNVSGGQVNYTAATVTPSELLGSDGKVYTFNQAPAGLTYTGILGAPTGQLDRWGVVPSYSPSQVSSGFVTPGYVAGQAGGTLSVVSPVAVLDGQVQATVTQGVRQTSGLDPLATASTLVLGARTNGSTSFGIDGFVSAGLNDLDIDDASSTLVAGFWSNPLTSALPAASHIAASTINASGAGQLTVTTNDGIALGADLAMPTGAVVDLAAGGAAGADLEADIHTTGGSVSVVTRPALGLGFAGGVTLGAGKVIDVSADWVNRALDGATAMAATSGGSVTLSSGAALDLQDASRIDVSGGATVSTAGAVAGTSAGSVTLQSGMSLSDADAPATVHIGSRLVADSLGGGGTLTLDADAITIGAGAIPSGVADGAAIGSLVLSSAFFDQGAFTNYNVGAVHTLTLAPGVSLRPQASNWILGPGAAQEPTGTAPSSFMNLGTLLASQRAPASIALSAASLQGNPIGSLTLANGSSIVTDPLASVRLSAGDQINLGGTISDPGGNVALSLVGTPPQSPTPGQLNLGASARIDVSGTAVLQPQTGALPTGQVLAGGNVTLAVTNGTVTPITIAQGAVIAADGTSATLGVATVNAQGNTVVASQVVASAGGSISIASSSGGALAGNLHALGGDASVSGGSFSFSGADSVVVQQAAVQSSTATGVSAVTVSAQSLQAGFSSVDLQANLQVRFITDTTLALAGNLTIDVPALVLAPGVGNVALSGASTLQAGASYQQIPGTAGAIGGAGKLSLSGGLVELFGQQVLQGVGTADVSAASELRLESLFGSIGTQGSLGLQGNLTLSAPQVLPTTASQYTVNAPGQRVQVTGGDRNAAMPLSAGGSLTINAADIAIGDATDASQAGVLRAPFGSIVLNASDSLVVGNGSVLSVAGTSQSGAALTVPYGQTNGGTDWTYDGVAVTTPPAKAISLNAPDGAINVAAGSTMDLSGGGNVVAQEFVPGNGGSKDIFAGAAGGAFAVVPTAGLYAAQDSDILHYQSDANGVHPTLQLGRTVTFGSGGPIPAGTYAVMPAQYATIAGSFLVTPTSSSAPLALGAAVKQTDGSVLVGGLYGQAGTSFASSLTQSFKVLTSTQALAYSEIDQANANAYFGAQAAAKGVAAPALPTDAGVLAIAAAQLDLKGSTLFTLPTATTTTTTTTGSTTTTTSTTTTVGRGGELDIAADDIQVGGTADAAALSLSPADLNATGASLVVLGGLKDQSTGNVAVSADKVTIANAGTPLTINDLVVVANDTVTLQAGSAIEAAAAAATSTPVVAPTLNLTGDGALLRVSADATASSTRTGVQGAGGSLVIGSGVTLSGGAITAEGTQSNTIAGDATLTATAITLGAGHMVAGNLTGVTPDADTLVLTAKLASQVDGAESLTLRSATGLDLYGNVTLGSASVQSLTIDTGSIAVIGDTASLSATPPKPVAAIIEAGGVTLQNTTGNAGAVSTGINTLQVQALASDAAAGTGQVLIGPGAVSVSGAAGVTLSAAHEVVLADQAVLSTPGDLAISASSLQATRAAQASLAAGGSFTLATTGTASGTAAGAGAQVTISAASIAQGGNVVLPSGQLTLAASGSGNAVQFAAGSHTDLAGRDSAPFDGTVIGTPGGTLGVLAATGGVSVDLGAAIDVSGAAAGGNAGSVTISAPAGSVALQGSLLGTAATGQAGGSLSIDSAGALDLAALAATLAAAPGNFGGSLAIRNRSGDQTLAAGTTLAAQSITLSADSGALTIAGSLDAAGTTGPRIVLAGGAALDIDASASIHANGSGSTGGEVELMSGDRQLQSDGTFSGSTGTVNFNGGKIDTSGATNGTLLVRAQRGADGTGVAIGGSGGTTVTGAGQVQVESVKQYAASTVNDAVITQVNTDNQVLGQTAATVLARVGALIGQPTSALQLRSGVEIDSTGDLAMVGNAAAGGWNLTSFASNGAVQAQASGAPMDLTLRAGGNLNITGSLSDGFLPSGTAPTTMAAAAKIAPSAVIAQVNGSYAQGANIRLVGGADLGAADVMTTTASADAGDVTIGAAGKNVLVRTTTGDIAIAAGRDVTLVNAQADVYTTGTPVTAQQLQSDGYVGNQLPAAAYLHNGAAGSVTTAQSPFLTGGGSLSVEAGRDIVGADPDAATLQISSAWAWRASDQKTNGQPMWWSRYDLFQQGFATFGGGDVTAAAGQDLVNASFTTATSGFIARTPSGSVGSAVNFPGGDLAVQAGRDIVGGSVMATGTTGSVQAGRDITSSNTDASAPFALQVQYGNTALNIVALDNLELGLVSAFTLTPASNEYLSATAVSSFMTIMGLTPQATLNALAGAGDLTYFATIDMYEAEPTNGQLIDADRVIPDISSFSAPNGSITAGQLIQIPTSTTKLSLLAADNLNLISVSVGGSNLSPQVPTLIAGGDPVTDPLSDYTVGLTPYDDGTRSPMELVAQTGDLSLSLGIKTTTALRMIAGRDLLLGQQTGDSYIGITLQHNDASELSLLEAGRDIDFPNPSSGRSGALNFYGRGNLLVLAGRNIDLSESSGILALGNRQNAALPSVGGAVTVAAGVSLAGGDYTQAASWYFPLLGGTGVAGFASDLFAQLSALKAGQTLPNLGSSAAQQYAASGVADQITQVKALVGDDVLNAAILADAQRRESNPALDLQTAQADFAKLAASAQATVLDAALASAWVATVPATQQQAQVVAMATSGTTPSPYVALLQKFLVAQGQPAAADASTALSRFEQMAPEQQALFTNLVLVDVIRKSGRAASQQSAADLKAAAYQPAYDALALVFPSAAGSGNLEMGSSQVETLQNSDITVLAPRGSVDVGTVAASFNPKPASSLGIVTAAGGNLSVIVDGSVNVDQSRVFTVGLGDLLMWASNGSLDAGRGGKTVVGAPSPVYRLDPTTGEFTIDLSGSFSGSGIAVLNAASDLDLYAPKGEINAGDAGIKALGNAFLGAATFVNTDALTVGGTAVGAPPPASTGGGTAGLAAVAGNAAAATTVNAGDSEEEKERKRRKRLNLVLDFLGFGDGSSKP